MRSVLVDTNIFVYLLEDDLQFSNLSHQLFKKIETGQLIACASAISYAELMVYPFRKNKSDLVLKYKELLLGYPNLTFKPVSLEISEGAAKIRGQKSTLKLMDALILATGLVCEVDAIVSEDKILASVDVSVPVMSLKECLAS